MEDITIETKLNPKELLGLRYRFFFTNPRIIFAYLTGLLLVFLMTRYIDTAQPFRDAVIQLINKNSDPASIILYINTYSEAASTAFTYFLKIFIYGVIFILVFLPYVIFVSHLNSKKSRKTYGKTIYNFTTEWIKVSGETYIREDLWTSIYKVKELKTWLIIYISKASAYYLKKTAFSDEQLNKFRELLKTIEGPTPIIEIKGYSNKPIPASEEEEEQMEE